MQTNESGWRAFFSGLFGAMPQDTFTALSAMSEPADEKPESAADVAALQSELKRLQEQYQRATNEALEMQATTAYEQLLTTNHILPAQRDEFMRFYSAIANNQELVQMFVSLMKATPAHNLDRAELTPLTILDNNQPVNPRVETERDQFAELGAQVVSAYLKMTKRGE